MDLIEAMALSEGAPRLDWDAKQKKDFNRHKDRPQAELKLATPEHIDAISELLHGKNGKPIDKHGMHDATKALKLFREGHEVSEDYLRYDSSKKAERAARIADSCSKVESWKGIENTEEVALSAGAPDGEPINSAAETNQSHGFTDDVVTYDDGGMDGREAVIPTITNPHATTSQLPSRSIKASGAIIMEHHDVFDKVEATGAEAGGPT